ncbi:MAG: hypothetical protein HY314_14835 [Acidobacteria bacterium]|nr:hypothetical protein [Acidobacteriota bacterium]
MAVRFPFVGSDKIIYAMDDVSRYMLHCILEIEGHLDEVILNQAIESALVKSPILKSVARLRRFGSYWEEIEDLTPYSILTVRDLTGESDAEAAAKAFLQDYINEHTDITQAPPTRFLLVRLPERRLLFVVKVHHCAVDPAAIFNAIEDIQEAYTALLNGESLPPVGAMADRSRKRLFRSVPLLMWLRVMVNAARQRIHAVGTRRRCFVQFSNPNPTKAIAYRVLRFEGRDYTAFRSRCKGLGVTANELVMAALCRAIRQWNGNREHTDGAYSIVMPVDLRWYARHGGRTPRVMASFIGGSWVTIPVAAVTTFEATAEYVTKETRFIKDHHLGLLANVGFPLLYFIPPRWLRQAARRQYERRPAKTIPTAVFAYLGKVERSLSTFPGCRFISMAGVGAGFYPVGLDVVVLTGGRAHTVTVTYLKDACSEAEMDRFMALFSNEILPQSSESQLEEAVVYEHSGARV